MHDDVRSFVAECVARFGPFHSVVEVGSRDINGGVRDLFPDAEYLGFDLVDGPGVDIVGDFTELELDPADAVVCLEVLEHAPNAADIVRHALEVLKPGGVLIVTCAGPDRGVHSGIDTNPLRPDEFYRNVTVDELDGWMGTGERWAGYARGRQDLHGWAIRDLHDVPLTLGSADTHRTD